jgi:hypothetical protein
MTRQKYSRSKVRTLITSLLSLAFLFSENSFSAYATTPVSISGLASQYGPGQKVSYKIAGTPGDTCQLGYQNQTPKPFVMGSAGSVSASFTTGTTASLIVIRVTCSQSGVANAQSEIVLASLPTKTSPTTVSPAPTPTLPGVDASVNSTLSSIIEPLPNTCEEGELTTVRADALGFAQGDNVKVNIFNANNSELTLSLVTKSALPGEKSIALKVRVCQSDPAYLGVAQDYRLMMTYSDSPGYFVQSQEYKFRLISRVEVSNFSQYAISQTRTKCSFDQWSATNTFVQSGITRKSGDKMTIKGTFYRAGLVAPNDTLKLVRVIDSTNSKVIATTTTDKDGKYSFTFSALTFPKALLYQIQAPERQADLGVIPGPFPEKVWVVFIDCDKGCKIKETSSRDTTPVNNYSDVCLQSLAFYNLVITQGDNENSKLMRKIVLYPIISNITRSRTESNAKIAASAAEAAAQSSNEKSGAATGSSTNKSSPSASNSAPSRSSGGGRCYVRGYTTKKGKSVSGYYRSC